MTDRKKVFKHVRSESFIELLDGMRPVQVIEQMQQLQASYPDREVFFKVDYGYDGCSLELWESVPETDREYKTRLSIEAKKAAAEAKTKAAKEKRERSEYERLKKKFEKAPK